MDEEERPLDAGDRVDLGAHRETDLNASRQVAQGGLKRVAQEVLQDVLERSARDDDTDGQRLGIQVQRRHPRRLAGERGLTLRALEERVQERGVHREDAQAVEQRAHGLVPFGVE